MLHTTRTYILYSAYSVYRCVFFVFLVFATLFILLVITVAVMSVKESLIPLVEQVKPSNITGGILIFIFARSLCVLGIPFYQCTSPLIILYKCSYFIIV